MSVESEASARRDHCDAFAEATEAQHIERLFDCSVEVTVLSSDNHLVFTPMLPQVGRTVSVAHVAVPGTSTTKRLV
jgi:hypothetical protein